MSMEQKVLDDELIAKYEKTEIKRAGKADPWGSYLGGGGGDRKHS